MKIIAPENSTDEQPEFRESLAEPDNSGFVLSTFNRNPEKGKFYYATVYPPNQNGWLDIKLPEDAMKKLNHYISNAKSNPVSTNKDLAGNLSESLALVDTDSWFIDNYLSEIIKVFEINFSQDKRIKILTDGQTAFSYNLKTLWVNFQKQTEFNPPHVHDGLYSFVIFMNIPYDCQEQKKIPFVGGSNSPSAGVFQFSFIDFPGKISYFNYDLNRTSEGRMLIFRSDLAHAVYPFYGTDEERITISGNIYLNVNSFD